MLTLSSEPYWTSSMQPKKAEGGLTSQLATPLPEVLGPCGRPAAKMVKLLAEQSAASTNATRAHSSHRLLLKLVDELEQRLGLFFLLRFASCLGTFSPASYSELTKWSVARYRRK